MPAIYHEGSWLGNATDPEVLVKDTVGWTGKNLLKNTASSQTVRGVTFTVNADKSVTVNGTATGDANLEITIKNVTTELNGLLLSGCPANGSGNTYKLQWWNRTKSSGIDETGSGATISNVSNGDDIVLICKVYNGQTVSNLTFYPMLRDASITDPTYEPYHESVEVMYEEEIHGVNLLKNTASTQTINGVTFTVNADKSVTVNGTATRTFTLDICTSADNSQGKSLRGDFIASIGATKIPDGGNFSLQKNNLSSYWDMGTSRTEMVVKFTDSEYWSGRVHVFFANGSVWNNIRIYPMLRKADIEDSTYRPYNPQAIQNQLNDKGVLGAKNLLQNTATSRTINGVTFTVNADKSVTVNGTATANAIFYISKQNENIVFDSPVIFSGSPSQSADDTVYMRVDRYNGNTYVDGISCYGGNEVLLSDITKNYRDFRITVLNGKTVSNLTFKPMIRLASDPDDTYQPYAMTNRELTEDSLLKPFNNIISGIDLDNVVSSGFYVLGGNITHGAGNYGILVVLTTSTANTQIRQIFMNVTEDAFFTRHKNDGTWSSWYKFTGTVVS